VFDQGTPGSSAHLSPGRKAPARASPADRPGRFPRPENAPAGRRHLFRGVRAVLARVPRSGRPKLSTGVNQSTAAPRSRDPGEPPAEPPATRAASCPPRPTAASTARTTRTAPGTATGAMDMPPDCGGPLSAAAGQVRGRARSKPCRLISVLGAGGSLRAEISCHLDRLYKPVGTGRGPAAGVGGQGAGSPVFPPPDGRAEEGKGCG
jgi:hypothetical protein